MKKLLMFLSFICVANYGFGQGTLQFNQVLFVDHTTTSTVPAGKVWKVEGYWQPNVISTNYTNSTSCSSNSYHSPIIMNGFNYYMMNNVSTGSSTVYYSSLNQLPFWAPAGTTFKTVCNGAVLSIIEFNIIP